MRLRRRLGRILQGRSRLLFWLHCLATLCFLVFYLTHLIYPRGILKELEDLHRRYKLTDNLKEVRKEFPSISDVNYSDYGLNATLSNSLPLDRRIPDNRPDKCVGVTYDLTSLPKVSIIIPIYNELWSMLLRTLYSIIKNTPSYLLHEIIIVDDCSSHEFLMGPLDKVAEAVPIISIVRRQKREGLVQARMDGARRATAPVLVFLDGHVECNVGWIEPLLAAIAKDNHTIAVPHIDEINPETLNYIHFWPQHRGVFDWYLDFIWQESTPKQMNTRDPVAPILSPTNVGCAFAVRKDFFFALGAFDEDMFIWGGENIEISFRAWMCGGSVFIHPCSCIAHIFRPVLPYILPWEYGGLKIVSKNLQRLAEVWMDDYKTFYYAAVESVVPFNASDLDSLAKRKALRVQCGCKDFKWYLTNVYPEAFIPWSQAPIQGQIKNLMTSGCITFDGDEDLGSPRCDDCELKERNQHFALEHGTRLAVNQTHCISIKGNFRITLALCREGDPDQQWVFYEEIPEDLLPSVYFKDKGRPLGMIIRKTLSDKHHHLCLTQTISRGRQIPMLMKCKPGDKYQYWIFSYKFNFSQAGGFVDSFLNDL